VSIFVKVVSWGCSLLEVLFGVVPPAMWGVVKVKCGRGFGGAVISLIKVKNIAPGLSGEAALEAPTFLVINRLRFSSGLFNTSASKGGASFYR